MKHVSHYIPQALANIGEKSCEQNVIDNPIDVSSTTSSIQELLPDFVRETRDEAIKGGASNGIIKRLDTLIEILEKGLEGNYE